MAQHPSKLQGLLILMIVILAVAGFIGLCTLIGISQYWSGFLFLFYWSSINQARPEALPNDALGALTGVLLAYALSLLADASSVFISVVMLALLGAIYCLIIGVFRRLINTATMLFLTVATIPAVTAQQLFSEITQALLLAILCCALIAGVGVYVASHAKQKT